MKKWIMRILMIMSSVVFIISAIYIAKNLKENKIQEKEFENIVNIVEEDINIQDETNYTENTQNEIEIEQKIKENIIEIKDKKENDEENNSTNYAINKITSAMSNFPQNIYNFNKNGINNLKTTKSNIQRLKEYSILLCKFLCK